jgi:hypothetical protein
MDDFMPVSRIIRLLYYETVIFSGKIEFGQISFMREPRLDNLMISILRTISKNQLIKIQRCLS